MKVAWSAKSLRSFKGLVRENLQLRLLIEEKLRQLANDPFHHSLRTHKLRGDLVGCWSCCVDYSYRIIFEFVLDPEEEKEAILLLNIGTHDEVY
ncbi:MAG: type II toxin-antitoxin system mRNA interferase toxin, RelE/StbE family [Okeania sp. SIO3I5]|uniref:type II toxin-antitoxin system RelE/ParE family toxin n=1 Tax=Okeania sp. SIO3I5 TaxID=2607805 RepID=UPI0013B70964|nr:type II toxin-antitoxin system mRNA interferase toxin, RelE/StbE family [Okeania sp. SIO3I5]NEQ40660.1 type II toxin-antitoxin system mRNA interferase toxin, RelE/StbE family [Okeania sp. SIO3I5]